MTERPQHWQDLYDPDSNRFGYPVPENIDAFWADYLRSPLIHKIVDTYLDQLDAGHGYYTIVGFHTEFCGDTIEVHQYFIYGDE